MSLVVAATAGKRVGKSLIEVDPLSKVGCHNVHNLLVEKRKSFRSTTYIPLPFE